MKKRGCFGTLVIIALVIILIVSIGFGILFFKVKGTAESIHNPIEGRDKSELRDKKVSIKDNDAISVALFGVDSDTSRLATGDAGRTDTIILLSMNPNKKTSVMVSIPRDTYAEIVGQGTHEKINHAYAYGGAKMGVDSIEKLMNVPVDYFATVNMDGLKQMIDNVDGVNVVSNSTFTVRNHQFFKGQEVHLDGDKALAFIRSRKEEGAGGDFGRQERQQLVIQALSEKLLSVESVTKLNGILKTIEGNVVTDVSFDDITAMRNGYAPSLNNIKKYQLEGTGQILDDNLWYFLPNEDRKKEIHDIYMNNLQK